MHRAHISSVKVFVFFFSPTLCHFVNASRNFENETTTTATTKKNQNTYEWKLTRILCSENENRKLILLRLAVTTCARARETRINTTCTTISYACCLLMSFLICHEPSRLRRHSCVAFARFLRLSYIIFNFLRQISDSVILML